MMYDKKLNVEDKKVILAEVLKNKEKGEKRLEEQPFPKFNDQIVCSWSKWGEDQYRDFQKKLREKLEEEPFTWEGKTWLEIARKRNLKQKDN